MIVTVTANPSLDLTYRLAGGERLDDPAVEVHRASSVTLEASGKGVNVSRALTRAGTASVAVLFAGGSTGHQVLELLEAEKVAHRAVAQAGATRVNTTVLSPGGRTAKLNAPGTAPTPTERDKLVVAVDNELITLSAETGHENGHRQDDGRSGSPADPGNWLLICGSLPPGDAAATLVGRLVECAHGHGWRAGVDSSGAGLTAGLTAGADLLAPNAAELAALFGPEATPDADLFAAAALAAEHGCELLVSLGADGALWTDGARTLQARGPAVVPVNSAGAGDALLAGWFADPPAGAPAGPQSRLATAVAWGTANCLSPTTVTTGGIPPAIDAVLVRDLLEAP